MVFSALLVAATGCGATTTTVVAGDATEAAPSIVEFGWNRCCGDRSNVRVIPAAKSSSNRPEANIEPTTVWASAVVTR